MRRVLFPVALAALWLAGSGAPAQLGARQTTSAADEQVELQVPGGKIAGTLLVPFAAGKVPVALIIAGSGPTNRDGNSGVLQGKNNAYKLLAEALAAEGVASLRYDKRGIGASAVTGLKETDIRFETFVSDAASWIAFLRNDPRFGSIIVTGHSEGSLIGMLAARAGRADGFVSIAGVARVASDVLRDQLRPQLAGAPELWTASETILAGLEAGKTTATVPAALVSLYRPSVQPYLISWFAYVPTVEVARLSVPVLLLQGTTDIQVGVKEAEALKAAKADARLVVVEGMNHVLKAVGPDRPAQLASYGSPDLPLVADVPRAVVQFVRDIDAPGRERPRRPPGRRASLRDTLVAAVGDARIGIEYGRPSKRERAIWGALVPWGRVWMPGADEATTLTTNVPLVFGDLTVPAGDYTLYTLPKAESVTLIVSTETGQFHTVYHQDRDLGRVPMVLSAATPAAERLTFAVEPGPEGGVLKLIWDDREYAAAFTLGRVR